MFRYAPLTFVPAVAIAAALPAAAGAATTTRYEAEALTPVSGQSWVSKSDPAASGGKFRWLNTNGTIEVQTRSAITAIAVKLRGTASCASPDGDVYAGYQVRGLTEYPAPRTLVDPDPSLGPRFRLFGAGSSWSVHTFHVSKLGGINAVGDGLGPNRAQVRFGNDYKSATCDRNLAVDYIDVVS